VFPKDGGAEIKNKEIERQKAVVGGVWRGKHYRNPLRWIPPSSGMFIIINIYIKTILIPL
jgi:hypothetical protein